LKEAVTLREIDIPATPDPVAHFETFSSIPPFSDTSSSSLADALNAAEKTYIAQCLHAHKWKRGRVAEILGIDRRTLFRKMKSHGLL
jgi:DNA-binding NtrC family response regulator